MTTVTIGGVQPSKVISVVADQKPDSDLGEAVVTMVDTATNRSAFGPGDAVAIDWGSGIQWDGEVVGQPSQSNGRLRYRALGELLPFKHEQAYRVFYNTESSEAVKQLATERTEQLNAVQIHAGDDPGNWTSIAPIAEPYAGDRAGLYDYGTDLLVLGARGGHSGELRTTYDDVPTDAVVDGLFELRTRVVVPATVANYWSLLVEFRDDAGTRYRWDVALDPGSTTYTLAAGDAEPADSGLATNELRYRLFPNGVVAQLTAIGIDHAETIPFATSARSNPPSTSGVESTGRPITRRIDGSVGAAIEELATEDGATWGLDGNTLRYEPGGPSSVSVLAIDSSTPIRSVEVDRDYESVRNVVQVVGDDGVEILEREQASVDFYGPARAETVNDPSIKTETAARARARGILDERAWNDASVSFAIPDLSFAQLSPGDRLPVTYQPEGLNGTYRVERVAVQPDGTPGVVRVTVQASSART